MAPYTIESHNGESRIATSLHDALKTARRMLGVRRVYKGAEYQTDRPGEIDGEREYCTGLDIWTSRANAKRESNASAPIVISWSRD